MTQPVRHAVLAVALVFLLAHVAWLPSTFGDIDALNFALGVRDFDVASHQPHPPGYPVFIALAKLSTGLLSFAGVPAPEVRGLALLSAVFGAASILLIFQLFAGLTRDVHTAVWATVVVAVTPLFWFTALRPLSDMTGLAAAIVAQVLLVAALTSENRQGRSGWMLAAGAFLGTLAIGVRSQSFLLTLPLLGLALIRPRTDLTHRQRLAALAAAALGILAWAIPLVVASGGLEAYLAALADQAGEDFTGAAMLWTSRSPRVLVKALQYSFLWPWGGFVVGAVVLLLAGAGTARMAAAARFPLLLLLVAFAPYAAFHLVFQETVMTRYALPLVPPVALLAVVGLATAGRRVAVAGSVLFAAVSLVPTLRASHTAARAGSPAARIVRDAVAVAQPDGALAMHAVLLRHERWYHDNATGRVIRSRHGREVLSLVDHWRQTPDSPVTFMADPQRSDLALLDPRSREHLRSYDWGFPEMPYIGGVRPGPVQLLRLRPPGWMLDQGWAVTAEVAGLSARAGARPEIRPSIAWIRSRPSPAMLVIGGRHLGSSDHPAARVDLSLADRQLQSFRVPSGFFFERIPLAGGDLDSADAYLPLAVSAASTGGGEVRVSLEQFDVQEDGVPMFGFMDGWQEPEYSRTIGRPWRWASARSVLWVRPIGRDVRLILAGESPLRYFDTAPDIRVGIGGAVVDRLSPSSDFTWEIVLPERLLSRHDGLVVIESDKSFVPSGGAGGGDQRQLALRIYSVAVQ